MLAFWAKHDLGLAGVLVARLTETFVTLGLFTLPLLLASFVSNPTLRLKSRQWVLAAVLLVLLCVGLFVRSTVFDRSPLLPYAKNVLTARGFLGRDQYNGTLPESIVIPDAILLVVTAAAIIASGLLILAVVAAFSRQAFRGPASVPLVFGLTALTPSLLFHEFFDRYVLVALPSAVLVSLLTFRWSRLGSLLAVAGVVMVATWSIWWENEYLERRSALWQTAQALVERGIPAEEIDGGFEWNGWHRWQAIMSEAVLEGKMTGTGNRLRDHVLRGLDGKDARWSVMYARRGQPVNSRVLAAVPYRNQQRAVGVQRF
jgi:hypothetical protein